MQEYSHKKLILSKILAAIALIASLYCVGAIIDYSPGDPSLLHAGGNAAENITGLWGSYVADLMVQSLGYVSLIILLFLGTIATNVIAEQPNKFLISRFTLLWISLPIMALALARLDLSDGINDLTYEIKRHGGFVGYYLYTELMLRMPAKYLNYISAIYSLLAFFIIMWIPLAFYKQSWLYISKFSFYCGQILLNLTVLIYLLVAKAGHFLWHYIKNKSKGQINKANPKLEVAKDYNISAVKPSFAKIWGEIMEKIHLIAKIPDNADNTLGIKNAGGEPQADANYEGRYMKENGSFAPMNEKNANKKPSDSLNKRNNMESETNSSQSISYIAPLSSLFGGNGNKTLEARSSNGSPVGHNGNSGAVGLNKGNSLNSAAGMNSNSGMSGAGQQQGLLQATGGLDGKALHAMNFSNFRLPPLSLLQQHKGNKMVQSKEELEKNAHILTQVLQEFGVNGEITKISPGPVVTLYELVPAAGTKSSRVINLADDIARSMSALSVRIAVLSGKNAIGIELPNRIREMVALRDLIDCEVYLNEEINLPLALGKNIAGDPIVAELGKMPHLLVAGTTGSGKSVAINTMILSLIYKNTPEQCRFIMIDPKMLELSMYEGIPHLLAPVVTDPKKAVVTLRWVVKEMESRYRAMSIMGVRNIQGYNRVIREAIQLGEQNIEKQVQVGFDAEDRGQPIFESVRITRELLPYIVVIVDEMADLMLVAGKDIEGYIQRIAQMARAAGIHLIMATQRPSVDVITGVIKANFPTRISFQVTSKIDSRTILGEIGAEQLLGMGDMLFMMPGGKIERVHGPFVGDGEVEKVVQHLKNQGAPQYVQELINIKTEASGDSDGESDSVEQEGDDAMYKQAVEIVMRDGKATVSYVQRCLRIGYNRAANLIEKMERDGLVSAPNSAGRREVLVGGSAGGSDNGRR